MSNQITVIIHGRDDRLLWSDFHKAIQENISALREVGGSLADQSLGGGWRILNLSMNSPTTTSLIYEPSRSVETPADWIPTYLDGLDLLEQGQRPVDFPDAALVHLARMDALCDERIESIEYRVEGHRAISISGKAVAHASAIHEELKSRRKPTYTVMGELRGELGQITVHGSKHEFAIYDPLTDRRIPCAFSEEHTRDIADLIAKRIAVYGEVTYDRQHNPKAVKVESWYALKQEAELATMEDIREAITPLPDGQQSEDYVRGLRDGE